MPTADGDTVKRGTISKIIDKLNTVSLGSGITVIVNEVHKVGGEFLDEIAAAIIAIKMYIKTKNSKRKNGKAKNSVHKGDYINGRSTLWFRSWLKEAMREFDFNPYRRGITKNGFYSL